VGALVVLKSLRIHGNAGPPPASDAALVARACRGEIAAREALFRKHVGAAWALALRLTARREDADDVVQDAFVTALGDLAKLRTGEAFGAWLATIVVRQAHRHFRRRRLRRLLGLDRGADEGVLASLAARDASADRLIELAQVDAVLRTIDDRERSAWVLRHVEGHTLVEVAELCGCSLATAKRRVASADRALAVDGGDVYRGAEGEADHDR